MARHVGRELWHHWITVQHGLLVTTKELLSDGTSVYIGWAVNLRVEANLLGGEDAMS